MTSFLFLFFNKKMYGFIIVLFVVVVVDSNSSLLNTSNVQS